MTTALLLINDQAGGVLAVGVEEIRASVEKAAAREGVSLECVAGEAPALIERAKAHEGLVICAGGDGTQAAIASAVARAGASSGANAGDGRDACLLPLPCGTANLFCRDLGLPLDIDEALSVGLAAPVARVDIGVVKPPDAAERAFLNNIAFGAYADLAEAREALRQPETIEDAQGAIVAAAHALFHAEPQDFHVNADGDQVVLSTNLVLVSNNEITHARDLAPLRARLDDGRLSVYLAESRNGGAFAMLLARFLYGMTEAAEGLTVRTSTSCRIGCAGQKFAYAIDGDPLEAADDVAMEIRPGALKVRMPNRDG